MEHWSQEKKQEDLFVLPHSSFVSLVPNADLFPLLVLNVVSKLWMDFLCYFLIKNGPHSHH